MNHVKRQARLTPSDMNSNNFIYSANASVNKCGGSCNTIYYSYAWVCIWNKVKVKQYEWKSI